MPELPEVETIVNDLNARLIHKKIIKIDIKLLKIIKNPLKKFEKIIIGNSFKKIFRRAKFLVFELSKENKFLLIHLRMTGQLIYQKKQKTFAGGHGTKKSIKKLSNKKNHIIIYFQNGSRLFYNDQRQFGTWQILNKANFKNFERKLGLEPLERKFTFTKFQSLIKNKKINIKAFLLNQKYIAGIGNIYADEILFASKIRPERKTSSLTYQEAKNIYQSIKSILKKSIKNRGTTFNDYVDGEGKKGNFLKLLKVYQREGKKCFNCSAVIEKKKLTGRGTRYCSYCQN